MTSVLVRRDILAEISYRSVNPHTGKAIFPQSLQFFLEFALLASDDGRHDVDFCAFRKGLYPLRHHLDGLGIDPLPAVIAVGYSNAGEEQTQIIIYFGYSTDC